MEHLLRDVKDATVSTLAADVSTLATGLNGLRSRLLQIQEYLGLVLSGKLPVNHDIMYQLQVHPLDAFAGCIYLSSTAMMQRRSRQGNRNDAQQDLGRDRSNRNGAASVCPLQSLNLGHTFFTHGAQRMIGYSHTRWA